MAYDETLARRIRRVFQTRSDVVERRMFGGLAFLCRGRMCCGIVGGDLMVRVPDDDFETVLRSPHVRPMDFTGRPLRGFIYVSPPGFKTLAALRAWVARGEQVAMLKAKGAAAPQRSPRVSGRGSGPGRRKSPRAAKR